MYVLNSPLNMKDPTGRIAFSVITAGISTGIYLITTPKSEISWGGKMLKKNSLWAHSSHYKYNYVFTGVAGAAVSGLGGGVGKAIAHAHTHTHTR